MVNPLVTVVIPTFNSAGYLPSTLESILAQTYPNIEIVVVDDGSTDQTRIALEPYAGSIRYFAQPNWGGPSRPRNVAVKEAKGELIAFFDSDDLMLPDKVAVSVEPFATHPRLGLVFSNFRSIDEQGSVLNPNFLSPYREFRKKLLGNEGDPFRILPARDAYSQLLTANFVGTSSVVVRKAVLETVGSFDERMLNADDIDMWRRIAYSGFDFAFLDRILHEYRKRSGGVTARGVRRYPAILDGLAKQLELELEPEERNAVQERIWNLELAFGSALNRVGQYKESRRVFSAALGKRMSWRGIKGWAKAVVKCLGG